jgi:bifunctional isochorismate lyase / aryl carrier protein
MKEEYFTKENIGSVSFSIIRKLGIENRITCSIKNTALLVLDMQKYFLEKESHAYIPSSGAILGNVNELINIFSVHRQPVVYTRHIDSEAEGLMGFWWGNLLVGKNPYSALSSDIIDTAGKIIIKNQYDAFYKTDLEEYLIHKNIKNVVICGVVTHLCCEHTARSAFIRGYNVIFPVDATATQNLAYHLSTAANLSHGYASVVLCSDVIEALNES